MMKTTDTRRERTTQWVTPRVGKWSHRLKATRTIEAGVGHGARTWYVAMCDQVISNYRPTGRLATLSEDPPKPACPLCERRGARPA